MIEIRNIKERDRSALESILQRTQNFSDEEKVIGMELIDSAICNDNLSDYIVRVAEFENQVAGYYCIGQRALTEGVFDLYWIVVDPEKSGTGIGAELLKHAESLIYNKNGRLILAETSSRKDYDLTRSFYIKNHYSELAVIKDFYKKSDSLVIFGKYLN
ncbi:MAG: GNAT family N-acetyltransferase [Ignavibacteria bacterium]|nr:GNAT family N-acetyltransferase [Ignavibacteria bacterium]